MRPRLVRTTARVVVANALAASFMIFGQSPAYAAVCSTYVNVPAHSMVDGSQSWSVFALQGSVVSGIYNQDNDRADGGFHYYPTLMTQGASTSRVWVGHYSDDLSPEFTSAGWHALAWQC